MPRARAERLRTRALAGLIASDAVPAVIRRRLARNRLVEAEPSRASALVKAFSEDAVVAGAAPAEGLTNELVRTGKSLIRFGDGEALLLLGKPVFFQLPDETLRAGLFDAFFGHRSDSDYLLAVMGTVFSSVEELRAADAAGKLWSNTAKVRGLEAIARHLGARDAPVFDASVYREGREDPARLWESAKHVVIVANRRVFRENATGSRFSGSILQHVEVPEVDVLPHLDRVCQEVEQRVRSTGLPAREVPVIVAAGAVGKLVVLRLMQDHRVLDLGAYVGWHLPRPVRPSVMAENPSEER